MGVRIPKITSVGDLTVNNNKSNNKTEENRNVKKEDYIKLPEIGTMFMLQGNEYKVTYVNKGQRRFSAKLVI